jgi:hypothetical protein
MLELDTEVNIRASSYYLASTMRRCWRCGTETRIHGFVLPPGHEVLFVDDDDAAGDCWEAADEPSLLCYLGFLSPSAVIRMRIRTQYYQFRFSVTMASHYWVNCCEHCNATLGDFYTFEEPGEGFLAFTPEDAARIALTRIHEPFFASCGSWSVGVELFEFMRLI